MQLWCEERFWCVMRMWYAPSTPAVRTDCTISLLSATCGELLRERFLSQSSYPYCEHHVQTLQPHGRNHVLEDFGSWWYQDNRKSCCIEQQPYAPVHVHAYHVLTHLLVLPPPPLVFFLFSLSTVPVLEVGGAWTSCLDVILTRMFVVPRNFLFSLPPVPFIPQLASSVASPPNDVWLGQCARSLSSTKLLLFLGWEASLWAGKGCRSRVMMSHCTFFS